LSASLRAGVAALPDDAEAVVVAVGDQPFPDSSLVRSVIDRWRATRSPIVTVRYQGSGGHPVLFARSVFRELDSATGDAGARAIIERDPQRVGFVDVESPMPMDIDTLD